MARQHTRIDRRRWIVTAGPAGSAGDVSGWKWITSNPSMRAATCTTWATCRRSVGAAISKRPERRIRIDKIS